MKGSRGNIFCTLITGLLIFSAMFVPVGVSKIPVNDITGTPPGWSDEVNISNDPIYTDLVPEIAVNVDNIHAVWLHDYQEVYYSKSTDGGRSWSTPISLYQFVPIDYPLIAVSGDNVHVVWTTYRVMYRNSTDNGETWNPPKPIFNNTGEYAIAWGLYANNSNVHIISEDMRDGPNGEIYYRRSLDGGITFDDGRSNDWDRRITFGLTVKTRVRIAGYGSNVSIAWSDERDGDWEIYWMITKDNGNTWENGLGVEHLGRKISDDTSDSIQSMIGVNGSHIHIIWLDESWPGPDYRLYYRNSTDNGVSWNALQLLSGPVSSMFGTDIDVDRNIISVVWSDRRDDGTHGQIYSKNSTDEGNTWSPDLRLTYNLSRESAGPKIIALNGSTHLVRADRFPSNDREIFYKRYPDFPPDPTCNITLGEGWNLISLPLEQSNESIDQVLSSITSKWDIIQTYDPLSSEPWKSYNIYRPDSLNDFSTLNHKMGFWINITEPGGVNLTVSGLIPSSTNINLYAGCWNLVGYPSLTNETVANALFGTTADAVIVGDTSEPYHIKEVGPAYVMKPGEGYWIHVVADTVWVVDW